MRIRTGGLAKDIKYGMKHSANHLLKFEGCQEDEIRSDAPSGGSCQVERQRGSANVSLSLYLYLSLSFC